jgi:hypothetical protein
VCAKHVIETQARHAWLLQLDHVNEVCIFACGPDAQGPIDAGPRAVAAERATALAMRDIERAQRNGIRGWRCFTDFDSLGTGVSCTSVRHWRLAETACAANDGPACE